MPRSRFLAAFREAQETICREQLMLEVGRQIAAHNNAKPAAEWAPSCGWEEFGVLLQIFYEAHRRGLKSSKRIGIRVQRDLVTRAREFAAKRAGKIIPIETK
jgi:hypothetical protein